MLYALAPDPVRRVMEQIEAMGIMAILFFFVIFSAFLARPFSQLLNALISIILGGQVTG